MIHEPICCKCHIPMYLRKKGIPVVDTSDGRPLSIGRADKWRCPKCHAEVAVGFSSGSIEYREKDFQRLLERVKNHEHYTECNWNVMGIRYADESAEWAKEKANGAG